MLNMNQEETRDKDENRDKVENTDKIKYKEKIGVSIDEKKRQVLWKTPIEEAQKDEIAWNMLQNNKIDGIFNFEYYYIDEFVCFQYSYNTMQPITKYLQQKKAGFELLSLICRELLAIFERGKEYLLCPRGYLLLEDTIFLDRAKGKVQICYLPGKSGEIEKEFTTIVEYLMEHTDHSDRRAVEFIYGLYDVFTTEGLILENLKQYADNFNEERKETINLLSEGLKQKKSQPKKNQLKQSSQINDIGELQMGFCLKYVSSQHCKKGLWIEKLVRCINQKSRSVSDIFVQASGIAEYNSNGDEIAVGNDPSCDLCIYMDAISPKHAIVGIEENQLYVTDLDSAKGTYINGQKISACVKTLCNTNDIITFADISYRICRVQI